MSAGKPIATESSVSPPPLQSDPATPAMGLAPSWSTHSQPYYFITSSSGVEEMWGARVAMPPPSTRQAALKTLRCSLPPKIIRSNLAKKSGPLKPIKQRGDKPGSGIRLSPNPSPSCLQSGHFALCGSRGNTVNCSNTEQWDTGPTELVN